MILSGGVNFAHLFLRSYCIMASEESMDAVDAKQETGVDDVKQESGVDDVKQETGVDAHNSDAVAGASSNPNPVDEDDRKLFAGGLPQEATEDDIREYFSQYGEIESINLKTDQNTGRSRGFCFVVFKDMEPVEKAVAEANHNLKGKKVAVKKAQAKQGKIHIGKLRPEVTDEDIREFFAQHGSIAAIEQPFDKMKNERKNFCFITFDREEPAKKLLKLGSVNIKGVELEINKVTPKANNMAGGGGMFGGRGGHGGHGGSWGGYGGHGAGNWGGYGGGAGDYWGGYGGHGAGGGFDHYGGGYAGGWGGGYGGGAGAAGGWGGYGAGGGGGGGNNQHGGGFGGKSPSRGRGAPRGRGMRQKPY